MLADNTIKCITNVDITKFKNAVIAWFDISVIINKIEIVNLGFENLKYRKNKNLYLYYIYIKKVLKEAKKQEF